MENINITLKPLVNNINLPTVIKTAILPNDVEEKLFIATQIGEIFYIEYGKVKSFLDIRDKVLKLGEDSGYDERGLLGLAFHPNFNNNGLFYIHYTIKSPKGLNPLQGLIWDGKPNPCLLNKFTWDNRNQKFDHIDTVEEWKYEKNTNPVKVRTLLNLRRPFSNHNGLNSLNFSLETNNLILTTGDGGSGYDPFNLSQDDNEIAGKIIEIDVSKNTFLNKTSTISKFSELPLPVQETMTVIAKGVRNISGIAYYRLDNRIVKLIGNVGQELVESVFAFDDYEPIPVTDIVQAFLINEKINNPNFINFGWRGFEGYLPTTNIDNCLNSNNNKKVISLYNELISLSTASISPLTCYYHEDARENKFSGSAITGVNVYLGDTIKALYGKVIFIDWARKNQSPKRGVIAFTNLEKNKIVNDYKIINIKNALNRTEFYTCLGTNLNKSKIFLGTYQSSGVADLSKGTIYEITE